MFIVLGLCHCCVMQNTPILFYFSYSFCILFSLSLISFFFFHILTCDNHKFIPKLAPRLVKPHDSQTIDHEALDQFPSPSGITSTLLLRLDGLLFTLAPELSSWSFPSAPFEKLLSPLFCVGLPVSRIPCLPHH